MDVSARLIFIVLSSEVPFFILVKLSKTWDDTHQKPDIRLGTLQPDTPPLCFITGKTWAGCHIKNMKKIAPTYRTVEKSLPPASSSIEVQGAFVCNSFPNEDCTKALMNENSLQNKIPYVTCANLPLALQVFQSAVWTLR
jgi:hypothetical protein